MPKLGGDDCDEAHFHGEASHGGAAQISEFLAPVLHGGDIEIAGALQGLFTEKFFHEFRLWIHVETILPRIKICGKEFFSLMLLCPIMLGSSND